MPTVYPTAAGTWSTRTWNNDATGAAYGMAPQAGDIVKANGLAITIDTNITVAELQTSAGTTAAAGGSFTTTGTRIVNAITRAGTTSCLGISNLGTQNGDSYGGTAANIRGTTINSGGIQNGDSYGGSGSSAAGTNVNGGIQNGNSFGGVTNSSLGTLISAGVQNGNATGGSGNSAFGTQISGNGGIFNGNATGGTGASSHGISMGAGSIAKVAVATGNTSGAFGVSSTGRCYVLIESESGNFPKSLGSGTDTTTTNVPFLASTSSRVQYIHLCKR